MHLNNKTQKLVGLVRRTSGILSKELRGSKTPNPFVDIKPIRDLHYYRPIYSVSGLAQNFGSTHRSIIANQIRSANTSSGFFAPSKIATESCQPKVRGQSLGAGASVCESNEHLPSLPVADLNSTLDKLKESISPMAMNSAEFVASLDLIDEFSATVGPKLDSLLRNKANQTKNWLTHDWWEKEIYLKSRKPLVINSNPAMIYPQFPFATDNQQKFTRAASLLISGIIDYKLALIHGYNPEATSADNEFNLDPNTCYTQYRYIFGSTRVPNDPYDEIVTKDLACASAASPLTLVVSYRGKFFELKLTNIENEEARIDQLNQILTKIMESQMLADDASVGPGVLTADKRDQWAQAFRYLDSDSIAAIKDCEFIVSIDTIASEGSEHTHSKHLLSSPASSSRYKASLSRQVLHGDDANVGNRWFDKALQLILVTDDKCERFLGAGINYEHTLAEAMVVSKMIEYSYDRAVQKNRAISSLDLSAKQTYHAAEFELRQLAMFDESKSRHIADYIKQARQNYIAQVEQFELIYMNYRNYGSNAIKSWRFSPDSWFQVALQLGYFGVHKRLGPCYESASTRRFADGRTETIRSLTKEVAEFCYNPNYETMQAAIKSHKSYAIAANNGEAIDRVLMGYRMTFNELQNNKWPWGLELKGSQSMKPKARADRDEPSQLNMLFNDNELNIISAFFQNELIKRSYRFALSTSQVSSIHPNIVMSYGPLLADGYACCYNITGQRITAAITANSSNQSFSCEANELHESVQESLDRMRDIAERQ